MVNVFSKFVLANVLIAPARDQGKNSAGFVIVCACAAALVVSLSRDTTEAAKLGIVALGLSFLSAFDARTLTIPVWPTLLLIATGLAWSAGEGTFLDHAGASLSGLAIFLGLGAIYRRTRGVSGLGSGDALVAAMLGAWLSFEGLAWSVAFGGALGALMQWLRGARHADAIPFVPALSAGAGLYWLLMGRFA